MFTFIPNMDTLLKVPSRTVQCNPSIFGPFTSHSLTQSYHSFLCVLLGLLLAFIRSFILSLLFSLIHVLLSFLLSFIPLYFYKINTLLSHPRCFKWACESYCRGSPKHVKMCILAPRQYHDKTASWRSFLWYNTTYNKYESTHRYALSKCLQ